MPSTPTTKSQVQAYRFVLRRMESALVRKDPVMLHDPMRSHKRATVVGVILGVVGLVAFMVVGLFQQSNPVPQSGIVIASPSGSIYVVSANPHELIPVFNLASARLLLAAASQQQQSGSGGSGSSGGQAQAAVAPTAVQDSQLAGIPMGRLTGIPGGPTMLPSPGGSPNFWAVCDEIPRDVNATNQTANAKPDTTVMVGQPHVGKNLPDKQALLVAGADHKTYLIYHRVHSVNDENDSSVKAVVDMTDSRLVAALGLDNETPRPISQALLNAIPEVSQITDPFTSPDANFPVGTPGPSNLTSTNGQPLTVGSSFQVQASSTGTSYYVVLPNGVQQVTPTIAQIVQFESESSGQQPQVSAGVLGSVTQLSGQLKNITDYPDAVPTVIHASTFPVTCLGWHADYTDQAQPKYVTDVTIDTKIEMPADPNANNAPMNRVQIGQASPAGRINWFFMNPPITGLAVRAASNAKELGSGPIYIVDPRGIRFSVPDVQTAQVLGIADAVANPYIPAAPEAIVGLLPLGAQSLSVQAVQKTYDSVPVPENSGQYLTPTAQPGN